MCFLKLVNITISIFAYLAPGDLLGKKNFDGVLTFRVKLCNKNGDKKITFNKSLKKTPEFLF